MENGSGLDGSFWWEEKIIRTVMEEEQGEKKGRKKSDL